MKILDDLKRILPKPDVGVDPDALKRTAVKIVAILLVCYFAWGRADDYFNAGCYKLPVCDKASVLFENERNMIADDQSRLLTEKGVELRVLVTAHNGSLEDRAPHYFQKMAVGARGAQGSGVLLVVDVGQEKTWIETSPNLRQLFVPDINTYLQTQILKKSFKDKKSAEAVLRAADFVTLVAYKGIK